VYKEYNDVTFVTMKIDTSIIFLSIYISLIKLQ